MTNSKQKAIYLEWLSGKYTLKELAQKHGIFESAVSRLLTKMLSKKRLTKNGQNPEYDRYKS